MVQWKEVAHSSAPPRSSLRPSRPPRSRKGGVRLPVLLAAFVAIGVPAAVWFAFGDTLVPPGEAVAMASLPTPGSATLAFSASAGDRILLRATVAANVNTRELRTKLGGARLHGALPAASSANAPGDAPAPAAKTSCRLYKGERRTSTATNDHAEYQGMPNDCALVVQTDGPQLVEVSAEWPAGFTPTRATIEARRVPAKK